MNPLKEEGGTSFKDTNQLFHAEFFSRQGLFTGLCYFEVEILSAINDVT
jgi:hypothetical protein